MTINRARELMKIETECIKRANTCGRNCAKCELVQDDKELLQAYKIVDISLRVTMAFMQGVNALEDYVDEKELIKDEAD